MSLPDLLAASRFDGTTLAAAIGAHWLQGRTAYGGLSAALALAAVKAAHPDLPPLRSAQIAFIGPLAGEVRATPSLLRRGKNSAFIACDVTNADGLGLRALFLFMAGRASSIDHSAFPAQPLDDPEANIVNSDNLPQGFLTNFDLAGNSNLPAGFRRWARLKDRTHLDAEIEFMAVADALPPAAMALAAEWGPISTTTWQVNLVTDALSTTDGWWRLDAQTPHARDGASTQSMTIWNRSGSVVATATQSVALFV